MSPLPISCALVTLHRLESNAAQNVAIAAHTALTVVSRRKPHRIVVAGLLSICSVGTFLLSILGPFVIEDDRGPFYADAGAWCWINRYGAAPAFVPLDSHRRAQPLHGSPPLLLLLTLIVRLVCLVYLDPH